LKKTCRRWATTGRPGIAICARISRDRVIRQDVVDAIG
jgi:hypothetical protein